MAQSPFNVTKALLRTARLIDDGRRAAEATWKRVTSGDPLTNDRHRPPQIW